MLYKAAISVAFSSCASQTSPSSLDDITRSYSELYTHFTVISIVTHYILHEAIVNSSVIILLATRLLEMEAK